MTLALRRVRGALHRADEARAVPVHRDAVRLDEQPHEQAHVTLVIDDQRADLRHCSSSSRAPTDAGAVHACPCSPGSPGAPVPNTVLTVVTRSPMANGFVM